MRHVVVLYPQVPLCPTTAQRLFCAEVPLMPSLPRLFSFAREHQEQARTIGDELRAELWNTILDQLIDRCTSITAEAI